MSPHYGSDRDRSGTGGNGGAIRLDGNTFTLTLTRTRIEGNHAHEGGGAVFFVSNDRTGSMRIDDSTLSGNVSAGFQNFPGIFFHEASDPAVVGSTLG